MFRRKVSLDLAPWEWLLVGLVFVGTLLSVPVSAQEESAVLELIVREPLSVYRGPRDDTKIISELAPGDVVVISPRTFGLYRKILITLNGKPAAGFIRSTALKRSTIQPRGARDSAGRWVDPHKQLRSRKAVGLVLIPSYLRQGESRFELQDQTSYETTPFVSLSANWALALDWPVHELWALRLAIGQQKTEFTGRANQLGGLPGATSPQVRRKQELFFASAVVKRYHSLASPWWYGAGGAFAQGQKIELFLDDALAPTTDKDLPIFGSVFAATGYEWPLGGGFYFAPDLRVGGILSTQPMMVSVESYLLLAMQF